MRSLLVLASCLGLLFGGSGKDIGLDREMAASFLSPSYSELKKRVLSIPSGEAGYSILYFFSRSVPPQSIAQLLRDIKKFNASHKVKLSSSQSLVGMDDTLQPYLEKVFKAIGDKKKHEEEYENLHIRMAPEVFDNLKITEVPVMALAKCEGKYHPSECKMLYLGRGDVTLYYFFDKLRENNLLPELLRETE